MPMIPVYQAELQQRTDEPFRVTDTDIARVQGQAISAAGKGLADFGMAMAEADALAKKQQNALDRAAARAGIDSLAQDIYNNALVKPDLNPSGSDMVSYFDSEYDKRVSQYIRDSKGLSQDVLADLISYGPQAKVDVRKQLYRDSFKRRTEYFDKQINGVLGLYSATISNDPAKFDEKHGEFVKLIDGSVLNPEQKTSAAVLAKKSFADAALDGYQKREEFDYAEQMLTTKFSDAYTPDEIIKKRAEIKQNNYKNSELKIKQTDREIKTLEAAKKNINEKYFRMRAETIAEITSLDYKDDPSKISAADEMISRIDQDVAIGDLSYPQGEQLKSLLKKEQKEDRDRNSFQYWVRVTEGKNLAAVREDVINDTYNLGASESNRLLLAIDREIDRQAKQKKKGVGYNKKMEADAVAAIKAARPKDWAGTRKGELDAAAANAMYEFHANLDKYRKDPMALADKVIEKYLWEGGKKNVVNRLVEFSDPKKAGSELRRLKEEGDLTKEEYVENLRALKNRIEKEKNIKNRKNGIK